MFKCYKLCTSDIKGHVIKCYLYENIDIGFMIGFTSQVKVNLIFNPSIKTLAI